MLKPGQGLPGSMTYDILGERIKLRWKEYCTMMREANGCNNHCPMRLGNLSDHSKCGRETTGSKE